MTEHTSTSTGVIGSIRATDGVGVIRMEDHYDTTPDDLWSALTDPRRLARWVADVEGDLTLGGEIRATFTSGWEGSGRVDVCEPAQRLVVTMSPGTDVETVIEAVLSADGDRTRLVVEERGIPLQELSAHGAGWQAHVEDLAAHLAGREPADWHTRWTELAPHYREKADDLG